MRKTKGFSYDTIKDNDVINHINKQHNGSQYLWELVRKDMTETNIVEMINKQIEKYLKNVDINHKKESSIVNEVDINEINIDVDDLQNILGI